MGEKTIDALMVGWTVVRGYGSVMA